jgi:cytoskeletal protein RodZ
MHEKLRRRRRRNPIRYFLLILFAVLIFIGVFAWIIYAFTKPNSRPASTLSIPDDTSGVQFK